MENPSQNWQGVLSAVLVMGGVVEQRIAEGNGLGRCSLVAEKNGYIIGFIDAEMYAPIYYFEKHMNITGLVVAPGYRSMGVGGSLVSELKLFCKKNNYAGIRVDSNESRIGAHAFYCSVGFLDEKKQSRFFMKIL